MFRLSLLLYLRQPTTKILYSSRFTHSIYPLTIREIYEKKPLNQSINLIGYLLNIRKLKTHYFLDLFDGSLTNNRKHLQVVASLSDHPDLPRLTHGCSINVQGKLVQSTHQKQEYELIAENIHLINSCDTSDYPFKPKAEQTLQTVRQDEHLRLRSPLAQVVFRLRSQLMFSLYEYFSNHNFIHIQTPCLTRNDCEGGGETFRIQPYQSRTTNKEKEYFNRQVYLTVSGQLHLETAAK
jgi:asparaginyl-tRNA synthetase